MKRLWLLLVPLLAVACSEDTTSPGPSAPRISNLQFEPDFVFITSFPPEGISISGSVDFEDADGDAAVLQMRTSSGVDLEQPLDGASGITRGTIVGTLLIPPTPLGEYDLQVWIEDATRLRSNILTGIFAVGIDDGASGWTPRSSGTTVQLNKVARGLGGFFAVGYGGVILTSEDGTAWSPLVSGTASVLWGAAWSGSLHVAVGDEGAICTSADGVSWTASTYPAPASTLYAVAWSGAVFVAVGYAGGMEPTQVLTSEDGTVWTPAPPIPGINELRAVAWSGSRFVAMGTGNNDSTLVASSPDGGTWNVDAKLAPTFPRDLFWTGSQFVAVGGTGSVLNSTDGSRWEIVTTGSTHLHGVAWSGNRFVAVGTGIFLSPEGSAWSQVSQEQGLQSVAWGDYRYIAVGFAGTILTSP